MLTFHSILVFVVIIFILVTLYKEWLGASFTFLIGGVVLGIFGVISSDEFLEGFSNKQIGIIILLLLIGDIIRRTALIEAVFDKMFQAAKSKKGFLSRMIVIVSGFSAFLNNTPLVAIMMPYVNMWSKRNGYSPSKFLIPLSYAAIFGGSITLVGTSTNLIVNGLWIEQIKKPQFQHYEALHMFDFAIVGLVMFAIGFLYLYFFSDQLLPKRKGLTEDFSANTREYVIEARVKIHSKLINKTVEEAGLKDLQGLFLLEIIRGSEHFSPVPSSLIIKEGDVISFSGDPDQITDLITMDTGLSLPEIGSFTRRKKSRIVEVVISQNSTLTAKKIKDIGFRAKYDAAIISIHRNGEKMKGKIRDESLRSGDVLLLYAGEGFSDLANQTQDFYFMTQVKDFVKMEWYKVATLIGGLILAITLSAFGIIDLFLGLLTVILACLALKMTNPKTLAKSMDYNLGLIIVMSIALGTAMINSGAADILANGIIAIFKPLGNTGVLLGIYFIAATLAAYITNKAAVSIIFPIAIETAGSLDVDPMPFILATAFACAANFMTPIGYQTNLMVYGPGGYTFKDFFKIGAPLTFVYMIVAVSILAIKYEL